MNDLLTISFPTKNVGLKLKQGLIIKWVKFLHLKSSRWTDQICQCSHIDRGILNAKILESQQLSQYAITSKT